MYVLLLLQIHCGLHRSKGHLQVTATGAWFGRFTSREEERIKAGKRLCEYVGESVGVGEGVK